jgi:hypothetical protein
MKLTVTITLAALAAVMGPGAVLAQDDSHYKDLYELKELHVAFHQAISHAGLDAPTKAQHLAAMLALWTDDGVLTAGGVSYSGKGTPGAATCARKVGGVWYFWHVQSAGIAPPTIDVYQ